MKKILLVEDDPSLGFVVRDNLVMRGYDVTLCDDGDKGHDTFLTQPFNLCILDVMLPKKDGYTLARAIREKNRNVPIIFLTAKSMTADKLEGFRTGADDFITKPFSLDELFYRIEVFLRRSTAGADASENVNSIGQYAFDARNLTLVLNETTKNLTQKEADVLALLLQHSDRVLKREEILTAVWGTDDYFMGRSLDVFISKLRKYLKDDPAVQIINHHGVGFRLDIR